MKLAAFLGAFLVAAGAALAAGEREQQYRNPTAGRSLVLQIPGMHRARVRRGFLYRRAGRERLRLDVYYPRGGTSRRLPAVLLGGPAGFRTGRESGQKVGWAQLIAASGMAAITFDIRSDGGLQRPSEPAEDVAAAIAFVRNRAAFLRIDPARLCTLGFSIGTAPWHLWTTMREPASFVRCNTVFYGPLDFDDLGPSFGMDPAAAREFSARRLLELHGASIPPMLVVKAGREENAGINESIDRFAASAAQRSAPVQIVTHPTGPHAFDVRLPGARSRALIRQALAFMKSRLTAPTLAAAKPPPLRLQQRCVTRAERRQVVRFRAIDGVRLIGVLLGKGQRAVVLAHQGGGGGADLCVWMPYARSLARAGYRVLALDHRGHGSSGQASSVSRLTRVDFDVLGAIRFVRARGAKQIVLAGGSLGGAAVIAAGAAGRPPVQGVISFASPTTFGRVDVMGAARNLRVPSLFLSADRDEGFPEAAQALYDATPPGDKRIWIFPGFRHGAPVLRDPAVKTVVDSWIRDHMPVVSFQAETARTGYRLARLPFRVAAPIHITAPRPANGRVYVVQRAGVIRALAGRRLESAPFLDIRRQVSVAGERGLFSLAFHPRYAANRLVYVCYTDRAGAVVVAEYRTDGTRALPDTARVLVRIPHGDSPYHNGGQLAFGPDGRLYVGVGDGGYAGAPPRPDPDGNAQNLGVLLGKILALDLDEAQPQPRIVAYGLRNPWRFSVDPGRNALIVGDVGWTDQEEIDYLRLDTGRLVNFGWSVYEGRRRRPRGGSGPLNPAGLLTWPLHTYLTNLRGDCSIVGGFVYRGSVRSLRGRYVFGDYCSGRIWSIRISPGGASGLRREPVNVPRLVSFGEDAQGELYAVSIDRGRVYRFIRH